MKASLSYSSAASTGKWAKACSGRSGSPSVHTLPGVGCALFLRQKLRLPYEFRDANILPLTRAQRACRSRTSTCRKFAVVDADAAFGKLWNLKS